MNKLVAFVCLALCFLAGCASPAGHPTTVRSVVFEAGGRQDPVLRERLLVQIRFTRSELNGFMTRIDVRARTGIEVRIDEIPRRLPSALISHILDIQARLNGLLGQYAAQYGTQAIWCEDPSRPRMSFVGMPGYEDLVIRVQCLVADPAYPGGRLLMQPLLTFDQGQIAMAHDVVSRQYETARYPLPPLPVIAGPTPRPLVCRVAGE